MKTISDEDRVKYFKLEDSIIRSLVTLNVALQKEIKELYSFVEPLGYKSSKKNDIQCAKKQLSIKEKELANFIANRITKPWDKPAS